MGKLNNITILLVGASGSGKSTVADHLHNECGYDVLQSYTTRPRRTVDETGHIFVTEEEYEAMKVLDKDLSEDNYAKLFSSPLSIIIKNANDMATLFAREIYKKTIK